MLFAVLQAAALVASCCSKHVLAAQLRFTVQAPRLVTLVAFFNCPAGVGAQVAGCPQLADARLLNFPRSQSSFSGCVPKSEPPLAALAKQRRGSYGRILHVFAWDAVRSSCCTEMSSRLDTLMLGSSGPQQALPLPLWLWHLLPFVRMESVPDSSCLSKVGCLCDLQHFIEVQA